MGVFHTLLIGYFLTNSEFFAKQISWTLARINKRSPNFGENGLKIYTLPVCLLKLMGCLENNDVFSLCFLCSDASQVSLQPNICTWFLFRAGGFSLSPCFVLPISNKNVYQIKRGRLPLSSKLVAEKILRLKTYSFYECKTALQYERISHSVQLILRKKWKSEEIVLVVSQKSRLLILPAHLWTSKYY